MSTAKILIHVALSPVTPKIYARTITSLFNLEWGGKLDYLFDRNDAPVDRGAIRNTKYRDIVDKHNHARQVALDAGYDAILFVENDMILPPDALTKLLTVDADVTYGLYSARHGWHKWLCALELQERDAVWITDRPQRAKATWGQVIPSYGVGFGCTLVHRHVLEHMPFRLQGDNPDVSDDWIFALDCRDAGFRQAHHLGVVCGHVAVRGSSARILWPDPDAEHFHTVEFFDKKQLRYARPDEPLVVHTNGFSMTQVFDTKELQNG